jgi:hypothetical protein
MYRFIGSNKRPVSEYINCAEENIAGAKKTNKTAAITASAAISVSSELPFCNGASLLIRISERSGILLLTGIFLAKRPHHSKQLYLFIQLSSFTAEKKIGGIQFTQRINHAEADDSQTSP